MLFVLWPVLIEQLGFVCSSRRRHTRSYGDWSSDVCSSDLERPGHGVDQLDVAEGRVSLGGVRAKPRRDRRGDTRAVARGKAGFARHELAHEALRFTGQAADLGGLPRAEWRDGAEREPVDARLRRADDVRARRDVAEALILRREDDEQKAEAVEARQKVDDAKEVADEHRSEAGGRAVATDHAQPVRPLADGL